MGSMNIYVSNLKARTMEAVAKGKERLAAEAKAEEARRLAENTEMRAKADAVLASIPNACEDAAAKGKNSAMIMAEDKYSYYKSEFVDKGTGNARWTANIIGGPGLIVIHECQKAGLKVDVRYAYDGGGVKSWAEIWVSW